MIWSKWSGKYVIFQPVFQRNCHEVAFGPLVTTLFEPDWSGRVHSTKQASPQRDKALLDCIKIGRFESSGMVAETAKVMQYCTRIHRHKDGRHMTVRKSISFTNQHDEWIKGQMATGQYASESEVIRSLIREKQMRKQETPEDLKAIRAMLEASEASGFSPRTHLQIMAETKTELSKDAQP